METVDLGGKERQRQTHHVEQPVWSVGEAVGGHGQGRMGTPDCLFGWESNTALKSEVY